MAIQSQITDGIGLIILDRPEKANAYDRAHLESLQAKFQHLSGAVKAVVFHSAHPRFFCAGADLDEMRDAKPEDARNLLSQRVFTEISRSPVISIAVVDGPAVAGGFELALATDLRVIGANASFRLPEVSLGIIPAAGGSTRLTATLGASIAKHVILANQPISAAQAVAWGLGIEAEGDPLETALIWARHITTNPDAAQSAKRIINAAAEDRSLQDERETQAALYGKKNG